MVMGVIAKRKAVRLGVVGVVPALPSSSVGE
jgi:hypothetical protein